MNEAKILVDVNLMVMTLRINFVRGNRKEDQKSFLTQR